MSICLLLIDDGREDYLARCLASLEPHRAEFETSVLIEDPEHRLGFAGAIDAGWDQALDTGCSFIFHVEGDFTFSSPLELDRMTAILEAHEHLAQIALKRQPWGQRESAAGGIFEADPDDFHEHQDEGGTWVEQRRFFTTNPSLYRREIAERGWPQTEHSEGIFTHQLLAAGYAFAYFGALDDPPRVEHIGAARAGHGY